MYFSKFCASHMLGKMHVRNLRYTLSLKIGCPETLSFDDFAT